MRMFKKYFSSLYLNQRFYQLLALIVLLSIVAYLIPLLRPWPPLLLSVFCLVVAVDYIRIYSHDLISARRVTPVRLSNGDENEVLIDVGNSYPFMVSLIIRDELPEQLQVRDFLLGERLPAGSSKVLSYSIRPVKRGEYIFGSLNVFVHTGLNFISRRYQFMEPVSVPVYPSFLQLKSFSLLAQAQHSAAYGFRKIQRAGQSMEYDQIQNYVQGNDVRLINWKATARAASLMVNSFTEERAQQVYCIIDKGRAMKSSINGLSLLDYAINSALVISHVAISKNDKAGLLTFSDTNGSFLPADARSKQAMILADVLHNERSRFLESSYELLFIQIRRRIPQRSLLMLYTNFDSLIALRRQLPYLRKINEYHLLVVVFFIDTELGKITTRHVDSVQSLYIKTIAGKFTLESKQILLELHAHGIMGVLTRPGDLTIQSVNKYLEIKARNLI